MKNSIVMVTGGASGIGRGICEVMANKGASIAIADINENNAKEITIAFLKMENIIDLVLNLFLIAIIPAVGEELFFRGVLQKLFIKWTTKKHFSILITAFLFSAIHMQFFGFFPRFILGALLIVGGVFILMFTIIKVLGFLDKKLEWKR